MDIEQQQSSVCIIAIGMAGSGKTTLVNVRHI